MTIYAYGGHYLSQEDIFHIFLADCFVSPGLGWEEFLASSLEGKIILLF